MTATTTFDDEFNSQDVGNGGQWQAGWAWAPNGYEPSGTTSWIVNPSWGPTAGADAYTDNGGVLSINFQPTPSSMSGAVNGAPFLTGALTTENTFSQTYGYFEMNAELPAGAGLNSAFYLLPASGAWPPELDIEEVLGSDPTTLVNTAHTGSNNSADPMWSDIPDASQGFHTYAVDWEPDTITWYFDGKQVAQEATPADMHQPMYMVIDTLSGTPGSWSGAATPGETAQMKINWVHAYSSNPYVAGATPAAATDPSSSSDPPSNTISGSSTTPTPSSASASPSTVSPDTLTLALSEDAYQGDAQFIVKMDGTQLGNAQSVTASNSAGQTQNFTFSGNWGAGAHNVEVDFINDASGGPGQDRNLYVDQVTYDGKAAMSQPTPLHGNGGVTIPVGQS